MWIDIYVFIVFLLGIIQLYVLLNISGYYEKLQLSILKKIINSKSKAKNKHKEFIRIFNTTTHVFMMIGILTPYWYILLSLLIVVTIGNLLDKKFKRIEHSSNISKGVQLVKYIKKSMFISYLIISIKVIIMMGLGIIYYHGII